MKIVVCGPHQAGKSSIIRALDPNAMCVEAVDKKNIKTTVAMDHGHWTTEHGVLVNLFGTPGLMRFSIIRDILLQGADGILFVFDAINPEKDDNAISILNQVRANIDNTIPIIFVANKSDLPDSRTPAVICEQNYLNPCEIFATSSQNQEQIKIAIRSLVDKILARYRSHLELLVEYESNIRGLAAKLNYSKEEIRDYLNTLERKNLIKIDRSAKKYQVLVK